MNDSLDHQSAETMQQDSEITLDNPSTISVSSVVSNKPTVVFTGGQTKQLPVQQFTKSNTIVGAGVITTIAKTATIVYPTANKTGRESQKAACGPQTNNSGVVTARLVGQKVPAFSLQQQTMANSSTATIVSQQTSNTPQAPPKLQVTFDTAQISNMQQPQPVITSATLIQSGSQQKLVATSNVKTVTSVSGIQRMPTKPSAGNSIQKIRTITAGVNNQSTPGKNAGTRIQVAKSQISGNNQSVPVNVNQAMTNAHMQRVHQPNVVQKYQAVNQKQASQGAAFAGNNSSHLKVQQQSQNATLIQTQTSQKVAGASQKTLAVQRQQQKVPVAGSQKNSLQNQQIVNNSQNIHVQQQSPRLQNKNQGPIGQVGKTNNPNINNCVQTNMTKLPVTVTVSKGQTMTQTHHVTLQQISPQALQSQSQFIQKQQSMPLQSSRIQGNTNIQPKMTVTQHALVNLPLNAKVNAKIQPHQQQMLLRIGAGKSPSGNLQTNVKPSQQKATNIVKNSQTVVQQQQAMPRNPNIQPVKIIHQNPNTMIPGSSPKQAGFIKTIPAQKAQQRNITQAKLPGIKTSLNTNMNALKTLALTSAAASPITHKTNVKHHLLTHQQDAPTLMVHKNQPIKIQSQNIQQAQIFVGTTQFSQQQMRTQPTGQIRTILPVSISPEIRKDIENEIEMKLEQTQNSMREHIEVQGREPEDEQRGAESSQQPTARRMPLPYECLQFVLQDHNYGAPPPRTPPPTSPPVKQQPVNGASGSILPHPTFIYNQGIVNSSNAADDAESAISSGAGREVEPEGEETETAPEGEGDDEDSITRCICEFEHDDGYMICCDRCLVWQHVDCMGIDRSNIPDEYLCEICRPRRIDRSRARTLQMRKREELMNSDTSSDTSSTSSADTDVGTNTAVPTTSQKKRPALQQQQQQQQTQQQVPRRKSDPTPHRRTNNNNNSNNNNNNNESSTNTINNNNYLTTINKNPRQAGNSAARKKETVAKRGGPGKRRNKRRLSLDAEDESQDAWGSNMAPLRQWIERYEEAVTNHYSPELRARISSIKVNGAHSELRQSNNNMSAAASGKCRINVHSNSLKFLVATVFLPPNTPIVELRGKYMLSTQHRSSHQGRQHAQRPGPFVFFYRLPREGTEVCVDTRTYGNDARFVRRSCAPNAEVKHCIEKGTLHLYIVSTQPIDKNTEITIRHEQHDIQSPNNWTATSASPLACACGNPRTCQSRAGAAGQVGGSRKTNNTANGSLVENPDGRERRRRGRKSTVSEDRNPSPAAASTVTAQINNQSAAVIQSESVETTGTTPRRTTREETRDKSKEDKNREPQIAQSPPALIEASSPVTNNSSAAATVMSTIPTPTPTTTPTITTAAAATTTVTAAATTTTAAAVVKPQAPAIIPTTTTTPTTLSTPSTETVVAAKPSQESIKKDKKKMTREERKMEAIMKAFERLEKAEQRKQEVKAKNAQRKESGGGQSDNDERSNHASISHSTKSLEKKQHHIERPIRRKRRKGRARTTSSSSSQQQSNNRRTRLNSADSDLSSNDEDDGISMQSPPMRRRQQSQMQSHSLPSSSAHNNRDINISPVKDDMGVNSGGGGGGVIPTAAGLLLALANAEVPGSGSGGNSPSRQQLAPSKSPTCDSGASSSSQSSTPSTPLSSACLLVAAAVGPLAPGFKFPKTKKVLMNEWLRESPDPPQINSHNTAITASTISPNLNLNQPGNGCNPMDHASPDYLIQQSYAAKSLATLVQAANSVSGICDSPPQRKQTNAPLSNSGQGQVSSGSAKKRWLRQAISEECDSPNSRPDSPPNETVAAPPKKRRIARESLSSDNYTPPTTPTLLLPDSNLVNINTTDSTIYSSMENECAEMPGPLALQSQLSTSSLEAQIDENTLEMKKSEFYKNFDLINCNEISGKFSTVKMETQTERSSDIGEKEYIEENKDDKVKLDLTKTIASVEMAIDSMKSELENNEEKSNIKQLKDEHMDTDQNYYNDTEMSLKTEPKYEPQDLVLNSTSIPSNIITMTKNEMECKELTDSGASDPMTIDSIAEICCRRIEFDSNSISESEVDNSNDRDKSEPNDSGNLVNDEGGSRSDNQISIDEFDVEAQMKKITGDDGNDFVFPKEKIETSVERDKSFDGIEGLMESSKEDSGSEDKEEVEEAKRTEPQPRHFKNFNSQSDEDRAFKEIETMSTIDMEVFVKDGSTCIMDGRKSESIALTSTNCSPSEESMFDSVSNMDCESATEHPPEIFQSIPPLSERIRKKPDASSQPKKQLDFEASIIESTIDMESVENAASDAHKDELSTALLQLLETKIDEDPSDVPINNTESLPINQSSPEEECSRLDEIAMNISPPSPSPPIVSSLPQPLPLPPPPPPATTTATTAAATTPQPEVRRLKDPRKAVPNDRPAPEIPAPIKRKLSISEYRKRKQQSTETPSEPDPSNENSSPDKSPGRGRSDSASSGTSSSSSDDENTKAIVNAPDPLAILPIFPTTESDERKGGEDGTIGWSAAPTLVERQRENLTERLKREFGLSLSDDEEGRARKQGLTAEAILKGRLAASPLPPGVITIPPVVYSPTQLPPQPYIPPPGSGAIHYPQFQATPLIGQPYQNFTTTQPPLFVTPTPPPIAAIPVVAAQTSQFLVPQAPPGSNPYPPQFATATGSPLITPRFLATSPPPSGVITPSQIKKPYYNHPHLPPRA